MAWRSHEIRVPQSGQEAVAIARLITPSSEAFSQIMRPSCIDMREWRLAQPLAKLFDIRFLPAACAIPGRAGNATKVAAAALPKTMSRRLIFPSVMVRPPVRWWQDQTIAILEPLQKSRCSSDGRVVRIRGIWPASRQVPFPPRRFGDRQ